MSPAQRFAEQGYLILPDLLPDDALRAANAAVEAALRTRPPSIASQRGADWAAYGTDPIQLGELLAADPAIRALAADPALRQATAEALGPVVDEATLVQVTADGTGQAWHQDTMPGPEGWYGVNRLIYPREVTPEMGPVVLMPGSHRRGRLPPGPHQESLPGELACAPRAGTVILLSTLCWHRVAANRSPRPRYSINLRVRHPAVPAGLCQRAAFRNGAYDFATRTALAQ